MVCKIKYILGVDVVLGIFVGGFDIFLECSGELVKKIIIIGLVIRFWLNIVFV